MQRRVFILGLCYSTLFTNINITSFSVLHAVSNGGNCVLLVVHGYFVTDLKCLLLVFKVSVSQIKRKQQQEQVNSLLPQWLSWQHLIDNLTHNFLTIIHTLTHTHIHIYKWYDTFPKTWNQTPDTEQNTDTSKMYRVNQRSRFCGSCSHKVKVSGKSTWRHVCLWTSISLLKSGKCYFLECKHPPLVCVRFGLWCSVVANSSPSLRSARHRSSSAPRSLCSRKQM